MLAVTFPDIGGLVDTVIVTWPAEPGADLGRKLNDPTVEPPGMVKDGGSGTRSGFEEYRYSTRPLGGAGPSIVTVPVVDAPARTLVFDRANDRSRFGLI
jgi:hypothetical protein